MELVDRIRTWKSYFVDIQIVDVIREGLCPLKHWYNMFVNIFNSNMFYVTIFKNPV